MQNNKVEEKVESNVSEIEVKRHSSAHILGQAVLELFPDAKLGIGPAIDNGFYYDFDLSKPLSSDDLQKIEDRMYEIKKQDLAINQVMIPRDEAIDMLNQKGQIYKAELLNDIKDEQISFFKTGDVFEDMCKGPHVKSTGMIGIFKLTTTAAAYWKGDEKRPSLQRIYGIEFDTQEEVDKYFLMLEEAKKRDHRTLGKELGLFIFSDLVGKGLPLWTKKGATIRREIERFIVDEEIKRGYDHVYTPDIAKIDLYKKSGHYPYYKDSMYAPIVIDEEEFMLRPMTCPHHFQIYSSEKRSYRELPMRIAELAKLYRYEQSGELSGLMRVRSFCLADAHIIATKAQATDEINKALDLIEFANGIFGLKPNEDYWYRLSLGDRKDTKKYFKDDAAWDHAEGILRDLLKTRSVKSYEAEGEAAFYGPKLDIQMKNILGKEETAFTVQYDFVMPKRFELRYTDENGMEVEPIVIHRSSVGCIERTIALLIERYAGAFPVWLAPTQVVLIPIGDKHVEYAKQLQKKMNALNMRVELDSRPERMQSRIRDAQMQKVPYMLVMGDKEVENDSVAVRPRIGKDMGMMKTEEFILKLKAEIDEKKL
ncbi:MAG: threonine--tRNA ligase [bacterium]